jgi:hypothetical protein
MNGTDGLKIPFKINGKKISILESPIQRGVDG